MAKKKTDDAKEVDLIVEKEVEKVPEFNVVLRKVPAKKGKK